MRDHPERRTGETFVGNHGDKSAGLDKSFQVDVLPKHLAGLKEIRLGAQAYDIDGNPLPPTENRPIFVGKNSIQSYNRIVEKRLSRTTLGLPND